MVDSNNKNQMDIAAQPSVRRLKKIKRLVKRPLPKPLPANKLPFDDKPVNSLQEQSGNVLSSYNEKKSNSDIILEKKNIATKDEKSHSLSSAQLVEDTLDSLLNSSQKNDNSEIIGNDNSAEDDIFLPKFDSNEADFTDRNMDLSVLEETNQKEDNQNNQAKTVDNQGISPDDPNFLSDDADVSLPAKINAVEKQDKSFDTPRFIEDTDIITHTDSGSFIESLKQSDTFTKKAITIFSIAALVVGLIMGKIMFGTSTVVRNGLSGVVANPEVPKGRARCGMAEKTQGCVLYLMNPQRQDLNARDFYDLASQLTGRQRFVIETGNMRYSNVKIAPGEIAQFNIPPLQ